MSSRNQDEFLALLEPVHPRLWRFVLSITSDRLEAEDLLGETVLVAFERFHTLRDPKAFTSFLFTIATRIHREQRKRIDREYHLEAAIAQEIESNDAAPDQAAEIRIIRDALSLLPERQRETVVLFEVSGFSLEEIREIQGGTLSGVKSRLRRGRERLAGMLGVREHHRESISHSPSKLIHPHFVLTHE